MVLHSTDGFVIAKEKVVRSPPDFRYWRAMENGLVGIALMACTSFHAISPTSKLTALGRRGDNILFAEVGPEYALSSYPNYPRYYTQYLERQKGMCGAPGCKGLLMYHQTKRRSDPK
jgi:hypothetical protein